MVVLVSPTAKAYSIGDDVDEAKSEFKKIIKRHGVNYEDYKIKYYKVDNLDYVDIPLGCDGVKYKGEWMDKPFMESIIEID